MIDEAAAAARNLDSITDQLGQAKLQDETAPAASPGGLPQRSVVLLMADKCLAIMRKVSSSDRK